jgi:hypothetical protein
MRSSRYAPSCTLGDHSRVFLASQAFTTTKAQDVVDVFHKAIELHGLPASLLSDNGAVFTATPRKGKVLLANRTRAAQDRQQELAAIPPPNLQKDRAPTPNTQALPHPPKARQDPQRAASPARHVRLLLQPHPPAQSAPRPQPHYRPTAPGSRPDPPTPQRSQRPISGSAKTQSTEAERSHYATTANYTTSASAEHTRTTPSSSSSPTKTSASSTRTPASSSANSPSTPPATTNHSSKPDTSTISRNILQDVPRHNTDSGGTLRPYGRPLDGSGTGVPRLAWIVARPRPCRRRHRF